MKKQSRGHRADRQDVSMVTPFPGQSLVGTKPRGVHTGERAKPTKLSGGAAEARTQPVEMPNRGNRSTSGEANAAGSRTR